MFLGGDGVSATAGDFSLVSKGCAGDDFCAPKDSSRLSSFVKYSECLLPILFIVQKQSLQFEERTYVISPLS